MSVIMVVRMVVVIVAMIVSCLMVLGLICSSAAAVTFSRDVVLGRYPGSDD